MRRTTPALAFALLASLASAQNVSSVYNRDTGEAFKLKGVKVDQTVVGPIVRTSTLLTFENPYKKLTEASLNFNLTEDGALGGFGYYYGDEYVRGQLMDKAKAWFIYTAITSRNRDPGIMEQASPTSYHAQIYPLKKGHDLRVRLWTVSMLQPAEDKLVLPKPQVSLGQGGEPTIRNVRAVNSNPVTQAGDGYTVEMNEPVSAIAQRFKDGRTYVAGLMRVGAPRVPEVKVERAYYEPADGRGKGADVTAKLSQLVSQGHLEIGANNRIFGDPNPNVSKRLRVSYRTDGKLKRATVYENGVLSFLNQEAAKPLAIKGLRQAKSVFLNPNTVAFYGWVPRNRTLTGTYGGRTLAFRPQTVSKGGDTARLWAQQRLAQDQWKRRKDVLKFSMKYGVPSSFTALLAVPKEEMKLFRQKEKEWNKKAAERRRQEREDDRNLRNFNDRTNWNRSSGGDPEIRVTYPSATRVFAILPDGRVLNLTAMGDGVWGGNFDIPAAAPEGKYHVRIVAVNRDGDRDERTLDYDVDRTAPEGQATFRVEDGRLILEVRAERDLAEVAAFRPDGGKIVLEAKEPGLYRAELPLAAVRLTLVLKDGASNKREIPCSWSPR
ncbi:MAG: VIT domain-containing protein [Fimbriimonas sp.]